MKIIDDWIAKKVNVAVIMKANHGNGTYIHIAGTIKECDNVGILFESSMKDTFYISYTSIVEIEKMSFDFICNVILGTLCVYQGYRIHQLKLDMLDHIIDLWRCQNEILQLIKRLYERNIDD